MKRILIAVLALAVIFAISVGSVSASSQPADTIVASNLGSYPDWLSMNDANMNGYLDGGESLVYRSSPDWGLGWGIPTEGKFVSIRSGQMVTFGWCNYIGTNGAGADLLIQECGAAGEGGFVEVSSDGSTWTSLGPLWSTGNRHWGTVFELDFNTAGVDNINYVRITDSLGGASPGFDVLTVQFLHPESKPPGEIPEFSTIALPVASILGLLFFFNYRKRKRNE